MQTSASLSLYSPTPHSNHHPRLPPMTTGTPPHQLRRIPSSVLCSSLPAPAGGGGGGGLYSPTPHSYHHRPPPTTTQLRRRPAAFCSSLPAGGGDFHAFAEAAKDFNLIPFCRTIFFDEDTSTKVYLRLTKEDEGPYSPSFISTLPSSKGRYTLIGAQPAVEFVAKENFVTVIDPWEVSRRDDIVEDPMRLLKRMMEKWKPQPLVGLPDTFCGGWFGYFSYDTFRYVEKKFPFSSAPKDDQFLPDIDVCLYDDVIVFDHLERARELSERLSCWDALQAALPSAVVCGAPKAKAMELIDQLEQSRRGPYGGGVGFVSFFGDMDMSVLSDMILFPTGTGVAHIQVGIPVIR